MLEADAMVINLDGYLAKTREAEALVLAALDDLDHWIDELLPMMDELRAKIGPLNGGRPP